MTALNALNHLPKKKLMYLLSLKYQNNIFFEITYTTLFINSTC